jgi:hypothetical protein
VVVVGELRLGIDERLSLLGESLHPPLPISLFIIFEAGMEPPDITISTINLNQSHPSRCTVRNP